MLVLTIDLKNVNIQNLKSEAKKLDKVTTVKIQNLKQKAGKWRRER